MFPVEINLEATDAIFGDLPVLESDPYLHLEEMDSLRSRLWVEEQNAKVERFTKTLPNFEVSRGEILAMLNNQERLPSVKKRGDFYYDYRVDQANPRGMWIRTPAEAFETQDFSSLEWEVVLDIDALAREENEDWVWIGPKDLNAYHGLIKLSRGGSDAKVLREFDYATKQFIPDGFYIPEAKTSVSWKDEDTLYVATDFGPESLTDSGYSKSVRLWKRGTPLSEAEVLFEGDRSDLCVYPWCFGSLDIMFQLPSFFTSKIYVRIEDAWVLIEKPDDAEGSFFQDQFILRLRSDWGQWKAGSVLAIDAEKCLQGDSSYTVLFEPESRQSVAVLNQTENFLVMQWRDNLQNKIFTFRREEGAWIQEELKVPLFGSVTFVPGTSRSI